MQVSTEKKEGVQHLLTVTVPAEDVKKAYDASFRKYAKNAKVDGFRKGHIPAKVLESQFGGQIFSDAYDSLINKTLGKAVEESKLEVVGYPRVEVKKASFKNDEEFVYEATVEVNPELELKPFEELKLKNIKAEVTDADVEKMIENLRKQQGKWQVKDDAVVAKGTRASIDFLGRSEGVEFEGGKAENFALTVGETQMIPGFTEQIEGHKAGDKFTIQVKFPEEYHAENLKGKDAEFDITVNSVSELVLPELNEDFVKIFGVKDGSIDTFKADLRKNMDRELTRSVYVKTRQNLFDALIAQYGEFAVPQAYIDAEIERLAKNFENQMKAYGMTKLPASFKKEEMFKDESVKAARLGIIVRKIILDLGCTKPSDSYVDAQLNQIAGAYEDPAEVIAQLRKDKAQFENIQNAAIEAEVVAKVMEKAADGDETMSFDELVRAR
ncbi:trigger factor [Succinivibrio dextrinosolvens]|jgi:trigger factor|uniref:trigger factor n=1 Tax=Succinivibrio dextrinosolvens TaxID=83771 RepID=UPI00241C8746|nr:trigger factor [Succinivibrio dextrinosolvens]MBE6423392.1 trigger factor [Succinivibrio dextrinosolvens]